MCHSNGFKFTFYSVFLQTKTFSQVFLLFDNIFLSFFYFQSICYTELLQFQDSKNRKSNKMNLRMHFYVMFFTFAYLFAISICDSSVSSASRSAESGTSSLTTNDETQRVERSPKYDFGLGKRRYMITTGGPGKKRLPHYNFGLGKRAR